MYILLTTLDTLKAFKMKISTLRGSEYIQIFSLNSKCIYSLDILGTFLKVGPETVYGELSACLNQHIKRLFCICVLKCFYLQEQCYMRNLDTSCF